MKTFKNNWELILLGNYSDNFDYRFNLTRNECNQTFLLLVKSFYCFIKGFLTTIFWRLSKNVAHHGLPMMKQSKWLQIFYRVSRKNTDSFYQNLVLNHENNKNMHYVKKGRIWSYSGPPFPASELNMYSNTQYDFVYGHFLRSDGLIMWK